MQLSVQCLTSGFIESRSVSIKENTHTQKKKVYLPPTQTVSCEETLNTPPEREAERIVSDVTETAEIESVEKLNNQA